MGHKLPQQEIELYNAIDEILWQDWDPIGVNKFPEARDEYYSFLPKVYSMAKENSSVIEMANYLFNLESDRIGNPTTLERCISIAEKIIETKKKYIS